MKRNGWGISMIIKPVNSNSDVVLVAAEQSRAEQSFGVAFITAATAAASF